MSCVQQTAIIGLTRLVESEIREFAGTGRPLHLCHALRALDDLRAQVLRLNMEPAQPKHFETSSP